MNSSLARRYLFVHGGRGAYTETEHVALSCTVHVFTNEMDKTSKRRATWSREEVQAGESP